MKWLLFATVASATSTVPLWPMGQDESPSNDELTPMKLNLGVDLIDDDEAIPAGDTCVWISDEFGGGEFGDSAIWISDCDDESASEDQRPTRRGRRNYWMGKDDESAEEFSGRINDAIEELVSDSFADDRPDAVDGFSDSRDDRPRRVDRPDRADRRDRSDRDDRPDRADARDSTDRVDRPDRPERADRPDRADRPERADKNKRNKNKQKNKNKQENNKRDKQKTDTQKARDRADVGAWLAADAQVARMLRSGQRPISQQELMPVLHDLHAEIQQLTDEIRKLRLTLNQSPPSLH